MRSAPQPHRCCLRHPHYSRRRSGSDQEVCSSPAMMSANRRSYGKSSEGDTNSDLSEEIKDTIITNKEMFDVDDNMFNNLNYLEKYKLFILNRWYENITKI